MKKPLSIRVYERMCPNDPIEQDDRRRGAIMDEMRAILRPARTARELSPDLFWSWRPVFRSVEEAEQFIVKAREIAQELRGAK